MASLSGWNIKFTKLVARQMSQARIKGAPSGVCKFGFNTPVFLRLKHSMSVRAHRSDEAPLTAPSQPIVIRVVYAIKRARS